MLGMLGARDQQTQTTHGEPEISNLFSSSCHYGLLVGIEHKALPMFWYKPPAGSSRTYGIQWRDATSLAFPKYSTSVLTAQGATSTANSGRTPPTLLPFSQVP